MGVTPIAFMPQSYIEGPLHGLADGGSLATLVPGNVAYIGGSMWRNTVLWELRESGRLVGVERPIGQRSADDREILAFARERNAMICSNDRYEDHIAGAGGDKGGLRRWLAANRTGYEFAVGSPEDAAYKAGQASVERPLVGSGHLPPPPEGEGEEGDGGSSGVWRAAVHAAGSSRPWALGAGGRHPLWGRQPGRGRGKGKRRRKTLGNKGGGARSGSGSESESDLGDAFPFWALADEDLPVKFNVKKAKSS